MLHVPPAMVSNINITHIIFDMHASFLNVMTDINIQIDMACRDLLKRVYVS